MRRGVLLFAVLGLISCADASARPSWPRPRPRDTDGGESLAPRPAARTITAAVEDRPSERAAAAPTAGVSVAPVAAPAAAAAAAPAESSSDEPINAEEIVIEVEGDAP